MSKMISEGQYIFHTIYHGKKALQYGMPVISIFMSMTQHDRIIYAELLRPKNKEIKDSYYNALNS